MSIAAPIEPRSAGAAETAARLFERHATHLYAFCLRRLRTREEAEDAVQQTFMKAFAAVRGGFVPEAEKPWLYRIAENVCTDRLRSATFRRGHEASPDALASVAAPEGVEVGTLRPALASLSDQQRRALLLREWRGLSYREIARELDVSQSAVEALIFRARRALARRLEAFSFGGALKPLLGGGGAKIAAIAVAGTGVVAAPQLLDRAAESTAEPTRATATTPAAPSGVRDSEPRARRAKGMVDRAAEAPRGETAPQRRARPSGESVSETQTPEPPRAVVDSPDVPAAVVPRGSVPAPEVPAPEPPLPVVPGVSAPVPPLPVESEVPVPVPPVGLLETVVEEAVAVPAPALPALP